MENLRSRRKKSKKGKIIRLRNEGNNKSTSNGEERFKKKNRFSRVRIRMIYLIAKNDSAVLVKKTAYVRDGPPDNPSK